jgi:hypothetical protein
MVGGAQGMSPVDVLPSSVFIRIECLLRLSQSFLAMGLLQGDHGLFFDIGSLRWFDGGGR